MYLFKLIMLLYIHQVYSSEVNKNQMKKVFYNTEDARKLFDDFITKFYKVYNTNDEYERRLKVFTENLVKVNDYNMKHDVTFGITQYMDSTKDEYLKLSYGSKSKPDKLRSSFDVYESLYCDGNVPESWDWREKGLVTPIGNQMDCGACWAFATIGNIEGQYAKKYKDLNVLSKQEILDCSYPNGTCSGGHILEAMNGIANYGIMEESDYPYVAEKGKCKLDKYKAKVHISGGFEVTVSNEEDLKKALFNFGPLVAGIQSDLPFGYYKGGIANNTNMNCVPNGERGHAVLIVGYGSENGTPYWIIKNSFGTEWGEEGYIRFLRNDNTCSILDELYSANVV